MVKNRLKVYGTRRRGHRERWEVKGKGVYREVRRDKEGKFISVKDWSPKNPISKEIYTEMQPLIVEIRTGREGLQKIRDSVREWEWIGMKVES